MSKNEGEVPVLPRFSDDDGTVFHEERDDSEFKQIIRHLNLKVTHQRLAILKTLHDGGRHITAQELFEKVSIKYPEIGFATVYRFLRSLTDGQFVTEVRMGGLPARYELTPKGHHDHLTCVKCGKIVEFENKTIESLQEKVAQKFGFTLTHHILELYGMCTPCSAAKGPGSVRGHVVR